jgi:hypothetical protein
MRRQEINWRYFIEQATAVDIPVMGEGESLM